MSADKRGNGENTAVGMPVGEIGNGENIDVGGVVAGAESRGTGEQWGGAVSRSEGLKERSRRSGGCVSGCKATTRPLDTHRGYESYC